MGKEGEKEGGVWTGLGGFAVYFFDDDFMAREI